MSTFLNIQKDSTKKEHIKYFVYLVLATIYLGLSDIYPLLPPMLGFAFAIFHHIQSSKQYNYLIYIVIFLIFFEATKSYPILSAVIIFYIINYFVIAKMQNILMGKLYTVPIYILIIYISHYIFSKILSSIFSTIEPSFTIYIAYYILIESIVSIVALPQSKDL